MALGFQIRASAPVWWHGGRVGLEEGWLVVDGPVEPYSPYASRTSLFELSRVHEPRDAIAFVERYGLLRQTAPAAGARARESWDEFAAEAAHVRSTLQLAKIVKGIQRGEPDARESLNAVYETFIRSVFAQPAATDAERAQQAAQVVAWLVNERLDGVEHAIDLDSSGGFVFAVRAPTLLGYLYQHLAQLLVSRAPLRTCRECGAVFPVDDDRQRFCSPTCSKRQRQRRWLRKEGTHAKTTPRTRGR